MFDALKKKTDEHARVISVSDDTKVNPAGSTLSGMSRSGQALQLGGTADRWRVQFALSDGTVFQSSVTARDVARFAVGMHGRLTYRADAIVRWEPEQGGE